MCSRRPLKQTKDIYISSIPSSQAKPCVSGRKACTTQRQQTKNRSLADSHTHKQITKFGRSQSSTETTKNVPGRLMHAISQSLPSVMSQDNIETRTLLHCGIKTSKHSLRGSPEYSAKISPAHFTLGGKNVWPCLCHSFLYLS